MYEAKNTARARVRINFDGSVLKEYRAADAHERFENEVKVLRYLEERGCDFVPRLIAADEEALRIVTTNVGARVERIGDEKLKEIYAELESYGVRHDDPFLRNITYRASDGRFCVIDFEFATILERRAVPREPLLLRVDPSQSPRIGRPATLSLTWSALTECGPYRPNNEDSFLTLAFDKQVFHYLGKDGQAKRSTLDFIFAISDGMGGENSGEFASRFAVDNITRMLPRRFQTSPEHEHRVIPQFLTELFQSIHRQLTSLGATYKAGHNMGATLTLLWCTRNNLYFGHIGDSRLYHLSQTGGFKQVSVDHTHVGYLRRKGELNERQARNHPRKNALSQSLGAGNLHITPQVGRLDYDPGDKFLICSDGVIDGLWDHRLAELVALPNSDDPTPARRIVSEAIAELSRDNATAMVVELM